jgi:acetyl-CoA carboxylase biotin carboxylase subunit
MVSEWEPPSGRGVRLDSHVYKNYVVPPFYDSLLGKLIISGSNRREMLATAQSALSRFKVAGVSTTLPFHARLICCAPFLEATAHTRWVEQEMLA